MPLALSIALVLVGTAFATAVSWPASLRSRERAARRRAAFVAAHPHHAKSSDLAPVLRRTGLSDAEVEEILARAHRDGVSATTMWQWLEHLGADAVAARLKAAPSVTDREPEPAARGERPGPRNGLPEVFEPGHLPGLDIPLRRRVSLRENVGSESAA